MVRTSAAWSGSFESMRDYDNIPGQTLETLVRYVIDGRPMGHFCTAAMANDMMRCYQHGDLANIRALWAIATWIYNRAPAECWGSVDAVQQWPGLRNLIKDTPGTTPEQIQKFLQDKVDRMVEGTQLEGMKL